GHAAESAALQANLTGWHLQADPLARWRQCSHIFSAAGAIRAVGNIIGAPISAMFPGAVVPLEHDFGGEVRRVQIDISNQDFTGVDGESLAGPGKIMLVQAGTDAGLAGDTA